MSTHFAAAKVVTAVQASVKKAKDETLTALHAQTPEIADVVLQNVEAFLHGRHEGTAPRQRRFRATVVSPFPAQHRDKQIL